MTPPAASTRRPSRLLAAACGIALALSVPPVATATGLDPAFLKVYDYTLRDQAGHGQVMRLHGFNLGGWLFQEDWMCPTLVNDPAASNGTRGAHQPEIDAILTQRFGREVKNQLVAAYQNAWLTTIDLDNLAAHGVNLLRVPFSYLTFMEEDGTWKTDAEAFDRLDWVVSAAWSRGIYCILDMHNVQGGQHGSGFWSNTTYQDRVVQIWQKVATRYNGNPAVAGYDLLNEPMGASGATQWNFVDRCYDAVRAIDPDHVVFIEAVWDLNALPRTDLHGWTNVSYSLHWYPWNQSGETMLATLESDMAKLQANTDLGASSGKVVHYNIGEFSYWDTPQAWRRAYSVFYQRGYSWTSWTYKTRNMGAWSLYKPNRPQANISSDTAEEISTKWQAYATASLTDAHNTYLRDLVAGPLAANDTFTVPAGGNLVLPHAALLANDSSLSAAKDLTITESTLPAHGTLEPLGTEHLLYVPAPGYTGPAAFTYRAFDRANGLGSPRPATVSLTITEPPVEPVPYAIDDTFDAKMNAPLRVPPPGLLANDGDITGRAVTTVLAAAPAPEQGSVILRPDGSFTFTPATGFSGAASFTYHPMAGTLAGAPATVTIRVSASAPIGNGGLNGQYYGTSTNWTGPVATRVDPALDFAWSSTAGPGLGLPGSNYSVKWTGWLTAPYTGTWTITETSDDAIGVYINGQAIIEDWPAHGPREKSGTVTLTGGQPVFIEVFLINYGGGAVAKIEWSHALVPRQVVPSTWFTNSPAGAPPAFPAATDLDRNGRHDLLDYALGGDAAASVPAPGDTAAAVVAGRLHISIPRTRHHVSYKVEASGDLVEWSPVATNPGAVGDIILVPDEPEKSAPRFMRLRVTEP